MKTGIITTDTYLNHDTGQGHPERADRVTVIINHLKKVQVIKGDAIKTIPQFLKDNPETMVSLLYLDFLLYEPSKTALENFISRMPKKSIIAFNTLTDAKWPGTMHAVLDTLGINDKKFKRFSFNPYVQYLEL